jgi:Arc/MetJ family transcription regulator
MRTNIVIDPQLLDAAMKAGPYTTKKEAVEAGLKLLARQAAYREILKWEGKLKWEGDESIDWTQPVPDESSIPPGSVNRVTGGLPLQETPASDYAPRSDHGRR